MKGALYNSRKFYKFPLMKLLFAICALFLFACDEGEEKQKLQSKAEPVHGKVEVFNSCGVAGAASDAKEILRSHGLDVLSAQTDPQWSNYEETIIAIRNSHWQGASALQNILITKNFLNLQDSLSGIIDATIFLGKDYRKVFGIK
jgi:hypothetical protein